jgi:hypothetical protein
MKRKKTLSSLRNHIKARARFYAKEYISLSDFLYGVFTQIALFIIPTRLSIVVFKMVVRSAKA